MKWNGFVLSLSTLLVLSTSASVQAADPWADSVVSYTSGTGIGNDVTGASFNDSSTAIGEPTRFTSDAGNFGGPVHPFNSPFRAN